MKYVYPAVFTPEEHGMYSVDFPDLESCYTCGEDLTEAITMAEDVLAMTLYDYEKEKREIPKPSTRDEVALKPGEFVNYIVADTLFYQKRFNHRAVKKTLSIPEWLNDLAISANVNFSKTLQDALMAELHVEA